MFQSMHKRLEDIARETQKPITTTAELSPSLGPICMESTSFVFGIYKLHFEVGLYLMILYFYV